MQALLPCALGFAVAVVVLAIVMQRIGRGLANAPGANLRGLKRLGLAVQLSHGRDDFVHMVGVADGSPGRNNRRVLRQLQYWDFLFIGAYAGLFLALARGLGTTSIPGAAVFRALTIGFILIAALFDVLEDIAILRAVKNDAGGQPIRRFGLPKWLFFYLAVATLAPLFAAAPIHRLLAQGIGAILLAAGLVGLAGVAFRRDTLIERASGLFAAGGLVLLFWLLWGITGW
jgi:hypothetical protein